VISHEDQVEEKWQKTSWQLGESMSRVCSLSAPMLRDEAWVAATAITIYAMMDARDKKKL